MIRRSFILTTSIILTTLSLSAQGSDTVRICTYNVLRFGANSNERIDEYRKILNEIKPQLLFVQELASEEGFNLFKDSVALVLDIPLVALPFRSCEEGTQDSYVAIFYDATTFSSNLVGTIPDTPRHMATSRIHHQVSGDSIHVATGHLKAGEAGADEEMRFQSAQLLRQVMLKDAPPFFPAYDNLLFAGDLNIYTADEPAYRVLLHPDTGAYVDPIDRPGDWHDNEMFAGLHTQSTRDRQFGGGVEGGMDDRFDQILVSQPLLGHVIYDSYTTFGNDGLHFNDSINALPNLAVSPEMAQALHDASDHLPVYLDLIFPKPSSGVEEIEEDKIRRLNLK